MPSRFEPARLDSGALSFGARMRYERERRGISIASIAETTKILGALLEGLEHDDVSRWPTGLYRRAFFRAYSRAIGLDSEVTVKEFLEHFPDPDAVALTPSAPVEPADSPASIVAAIASITPKMPNGWMRVAAPRPGAWFSTGTLVRGFGLRCLAAAVDWFVLCVIGLAIYAVVGWFWAPLCAAAAIYYSGGILLLGNTPGVCLFAEPGTLRKRGPVSLNFLRHSTDREMADSAV